MNKPVRIASHKINPHPNRGFSVVPYDSQWPQVYEQLAKQIKQVLGSKILRLEHVGSTAVPGLAAKPQIDIVVVVDNLGLVKQSYDQMQSAGFVNRGDYVGMGEEYFTKDSTDGLRLASVHVLPKGHVWIDDLINVRDYLRTHPKQKQQYSAVKLKAAQAHPTDYDAYYKSKVGMIQKIRQSAANWKANIAE